MSDKPRIRVKAGSTTAPGLAPDRRPAPRAGYLRDSRSQILSTRGTSLRDHREEVRIAWRRAAGLAMDIIQNSGRLRGAVDQVIADTVGVELLLNPMPDLSKLGYDKKETDAFVKLLANYSASQPDKLVAVVCPDGVGR